MPTSRHCCLRFSFCFPSAFSDSSSFPPSYQGQPASVVLSSTWEPRFPSNSQSLLGHSVSHQLGAVLDKQHGLQRIPLWAPHWSLPVMCPSWDYSIHRETDHMSDIKNDNRVLSILSWMDLASNYSMGNAEERKDGKKCKKREGVFFPHPSLEHPGYIFSYISELWNKETGPCPQEV